MLCLYFVKTIGKIIQFYLVQYIKLSYTCIASIHYRSIMSEKVVIITGASSGIGESLAREYAEKQFNLVLGARSKEKLDTLAEELKEKAADVLTLKTDVSKEADCKNLIDEAVKKFGKINILINNAGISMRGLFKGMDLVVLKRVMDVNFYGTVYCTKYALPYLLETKGSVVGVSSIAGFKGLPGRTGYSASKFAIHGFLDVLRIENLKTGLHVLLACPGFTASNIRKTALNEKGQVQGESPRDEDKMMTSMEVAKHIKRAIEKRKRTMILTQQGKTTVLINKLFPAWLDKLVYNHMAKEPDSPF